MLHKLKAVPVVALALVVGLATAATAATTTVPIVDVEAEIGNLMSANIPIVIAIILMIAAVTIPIALLKGGTRSVKQVAKNPGGS